MNMHNTEAWKGEHLIRGIRLSDTQVMSNNSRLGIALAKARGTYAAPRESVRRKHGAFVKSAMIDLGRGVK